MYYLLNKKNDETLSINFIGTEEFKSGDKLTLISEPIIGITSITNFSDNVSGETSNVYLKKYYQYKVGSDLSKVDWSEMLPIENITTIPDFTKMCKKKSFQLKLSYFRVDDGGNSDIKITLSDIKINGTFEYTVSDSQINLNTSNRTQIFECSDVLKIFKINNFEVISSDKLGEKFNIKFRFSQDNKFSWSNWEILSIDNLSTARIDKLRFVNMQYLFELVGTSSVKIYDVILYGDIQNVSANSLKLNYIGLKENCVNLYSKSASITTETSGINNNPTTANGGDSTTQSLVTINSEYQLRMNFLTMGFNCYNSANNTDGTSIMDNLTAENNSNSSSLWNPYETSKLTKFYNFLSNTINDMFGFTVDYHRTDPDAGGIDKVIFEYQLFNIVEVKPIKVLVPENNFPDNSIVVNQFNLDLFDTFKICVLKDEFKKAFGVQFRPSKEDILYFCQTNRMYIVKHSQIHKDVMNGGVYYDVILEKYEKRANVINRQEESKTKIETLTNNTTIDELFGFDIKEQQDQIANKIQTKPQSFEYIRDFINNKIVYAKDDIYNGDVTKLMTNYYVLSDVKPTEIAITYNKTDNNFKTSDNRLYSFWFNIPNEYDSEKAITKRVINGYNVSSGIYNFIDNMSIDNNGYKIWYQNNKIWFMINDKLYIMNADILTNVWYNLMINFNQREGYIDFKIYRRNTNIEISLFNKNSYEIVNFDINEKTDIAYEITNNGFVPINNVETLNNTQDSTFIEVNTQHTELTSTFSFNHDKQLSIYGSNMNLSNIRILNDLIKNGEEESFLNQYIVRDEQHVIISDNAIKQLKTINYKNNNWK